MIPRTGTNPSYALHFLTLLLTLFCLYLNVVKCDADFDSVRIRYDLEDQSGRGGDPAEKYWHESVFHPHYDGRFTDHTLSYGDQHSNLSLLVRSYLCSMADLGAETWIIHGTLLGWWWNRKIMPWDSDIDVQMSASTVHFLASYYNMTIHKFQERDYMLEINPKYTDGGFDDKLNVIDGRWIDVETGLFIDITAVRPKKGAKGVVASKDKHEEKVWDLFPLRDSIFEGLPVKVPYNYVKLLTDEYGNFALTKTKFGGHKFNITSLDWARIKAIGESPISTKEVEPTDSVAEATG